MNKRIDQLMVANSKLHMMDAEPGWIIDLINDELVPVLEDIIEKLDSFYDDDVSYGEPPVTAAEMHATAWKEHLAAHS